jgi:endonuclease YncB( thermonuclease family)
MLLHILLASAAVSTDLPGTVVSFLDGDTIEVLHNNHAGESVSAVSIPEKGQVYGKKAKQAASGVGLWKESRYKLTAMTNTVAPLLICSSQMAPASITRWSKTTGVDGIKSMRRGHHAGPVRD